MEDLKMTPLDPILIAQQIIEDNAHKSRTPREVFVAEELLRLTKQLPNVAGDWMRDSHGNFQHRCQIHIKSEQDKPQPDNALISVLCDAVRLSREAVRMARKGIC